MSQIIKSLLAGVLFSLFSVACSAEGQADSDAPPMLNGEQVKNNAITRVSADLNGDGLMDQATLIPFKSIGKYEAQNYELVSAWPYYSDGVPPSGPAEGGPVVLVINHGADTTESRTEDFLLYDPNKISVLATGAATDLASTEVRMLPEEGAELTELPNNFTGEVLILPTEAGIDTFVYWTGESYKVYVPMELP